MRELKAILAAYEEAKHRSDLVVLATVVHVEGSSYRRAGARMLVDESGTMTGAISGGCLEGDALRKALHALHQNRNKLITYDTSDEEDAVIGAQLGCNGVIQVLFEPIDFTDANNPVELLRQASEQKPGVVVTLFNLEKSKQQTGTTCWLNDSESFMGGLIDPLREPLVQDGLMALADLTSIFREYNYANETAYAFIEVISRPIKLVLVGAGNDAQITAQMADILGWEIVVTDGRPTHANVTRFVSSCQVIVSRPQEVLDQVHADEQTAFVLMTHNYNYDLDVLKLLIEEPEVAYIGVLGPRKKYERMLQELKEQEIELTNEKLGKVYAPVGLELGAETPEEIALSILSEIQAVFTGTEGTFLRAKDGPIHAKKNNDFKKVILE